jgi:hypothetical protein
MDEALARLIEQADAFTAQLKALKQQRDALRKRELAIKAQQAQRRLAATQSTALR